MSTDVLMALSPLDGRYHNKVEGLRHHASEFGLLKFRVFVEIKWLQSLAKHPDIIELKPFNERINQLLDRLMDDFTLDDAQRIKVIEKTTNHDIKAVEYFIKEKLRTVTQDHHILEFVHFACTSEDINNLAYALMLKAIRKEILQPLLDTILAQLIDYARLWSKESMLSRTHGQGASPTTMGKELANVAARLKRQIHQFNSVSLLGKINGAVGNYNAHLSAYPNIDWPTHAKGFVESLGLEWNPYTTQIEPHDFMAEYFHGTMRINTILIDLNRDLWGYIALGHFKQRIKAGEVGSSTMPHKVNPIDFENSDGNLSMANALLGFFADKLPISRWQRDLTDSTVLRNIGIALGYSTLGLRSLMRGLNKLELNHQSLADELENSWEILAEPIQTIMRRYGVEEPYEKLKLATRGQKLTQDNLATILNQLELPQVAIDKIKTLTPHNYIGNAPRQAEQLLKD